mgnify:CR=1 FL=1
MGLSIMSSILSSLRNVASKDFYPSYLNFCKLNIPAHISYASDDEEIDPASVQRVLEDIPHAESFIFSGGHSLARAGHALRA